MTRILPLAALALTLAASAAQAQDAGMGFSVDVSLSAKAAALLAAKGEKIEVWANWFGDPSPAGKKHVDEMGQVDLAQETARLPSTGGTAQLSGKKVPLAQIGWIANRNVQVLVNVYTARLKDQNNLLDCGIFQDAVTLARKAPVAIACKVIGES
jgi:hypothetical protein